MKFQRKYSAVCSSLAKKHLGKYVHTIIVTNIGTVFTSRDSHESRLYYTDYVNDSQEGYGRIGYESVIWLRNGKVYRKFVGKLEKESLCEQLG